MKAAEFVICTGRHFVDRDPENEERERWAEVGEPGIVYPTGPTAYPLEVEWFGGAWGFYTRTELDAVARTWGDQ